jgi:hypothetical protein
MTITITNLPLQGTVQDSTLIPVETAGITAHITAASIKNYISSGTLTTITATSAVLTNATISGTLGVGTVNTQYLNVGADAVVTGNLYILGLENVSGNIFGNLFGNVSGNVTGNLFGNVSTTYGNIGATIIQPNQPYITNMGNITLGNLTASANITAGNLSVTNKVTVGGSIVPTSNAAAVNIGSTSVWFNNIYGTAVHALYADVAERYTTDYKYPPGTVVSFGTTTEVTASKTANDTKVAGVVSTNPAYSMNAGIDGVDVALLGRVPCQVTGTVNRGDMMVTSNTPGVAMANNNAPLGAVIGKALGNHTGDVVGIIEVVVGRI